MWWRFQQAPALYRPLVAQSRDGEWYGLNIELLTYQKWTVMVLMSIPFQYVATNYVFREDFEFYFSFEFCGLNHPMKWVISILLVFYNRKKTSHFIQMVTVGKNMYKMPKCMMIPRKLYCEPWLQRQYLFPKDIKMNLLLNRILNEQIHMKEKSCFVLISS